MSRRQQTVRVPFRFIYVGTLVAGVVNSGLRPDVLSTSLSSISDAYELYRLNKLKFRILPVTSSTGPQAVGVVTSFPNTIPASLAQISELIDGVQWGGAATETQPTRWISVRKQVLAGPQSWYHTRAGTYDVTETICCTLCAAGTGTQVVNVELLGEFEFKDIAATANTPKALPLRSASLPPPNVMSTFAAEWMQKYG